MVKNNMKPESNTRLQDHSKMLNIDFDIHTDGDEEFKSELIHLMIDNIKELQLSLRLNIEVFRKVCHKVKSTILILNYETLNELIADLSDEHVKERWTKVNVLSVLCDDMIKFLEEEEKK